MITNASANVIVNIVIPTTNIVTAHSTPTAR